ncbi:hypothetical protein ACES2L_04605 [Bdellovibrio bacteriovorus]
MKVFLSILAALVFLAGCNFQQDPLADASAQVREGRLPDAEKPVAEKPLPKEALQIDAPTLVNGRVGSPMEFKIQGRVMTPDVGYKITVDNLADFPGATYDQATGEFKWTPGKAQVAGFPSIELQLKISLVTEPNAVNPTISIEKKTISLIVVNTYSKPIMNTVTGPTSLLVGKRYTLEFTLEDVDANTAADVAVVVRDCPSSYYTESIAHFVDVKKVEADATVPNKYKGEVSVELSNADNLLSGNYCFALGAVSKHGVLSELYKKDIMVEAKMKNTKITYDTFPNLKVGESMTVWFSIYDPSGNGLVSIVSQDDIATSLPGSSLDCRKHSSNKSQVDCTAVIQTAGASPRTYTFLITSENASGRTSQKVTTIHTLRVPVKAATP